MIDARPIRTSAFAAEVDSAVASARTAVLQHLMTLDRLTLTLRPLPANLGGPSRQWYRNLLIPRPPCMARWVDLTGAGDCLLLPDRFCSTAISNMCLIVNRKARFRRTPLMAIRMVYDPDRSPPFACVALISLFYFQLIADQRPMEARAGVACGRRWGETVLRVH